MEDVTEHVVAWLKEELPPFVPEEWGATGERVLVSLDADKAAFNSAVKTAFTDWSGALAQHLTMFEDVMKKITPKPPSTHPSVDATNFEQLKREFTRPYRGDLAPTKLTAFIEQCWADYSSDKGIRRFPYSTIVQSSGFGKSRLLLELATRTKDTQGDDAHMRVFYTCVRDVPHSTGFPVATSRLKAYFFPNGGTEQELAECLCRLFDFAMSRWETVGSDWIDLFTDRSRDASVRDELASFPGSSPPKVKPCMDFCMRRILVFAVDEAHTLLKTTDNDDMVWFQRLRLALRLAYGRIRTKYGDYAGIFAILVDTSPAISARIPSASHDVSTLFPPFVLTHTMDILYDELIQDADANEVGSIQFYQQQVLDARGHETSLVSMGRPLWKSRREAFSFAGVIDFAAQKLLRSAAPDQVSSWGEGNLWGVASMLCRLGIRPFSSSAFASRCVAEFMAVLSYVTTSKDHFVCTYASEPILAFGAALVWYKGADNDDHHLILHRHILPQLLALLRQEVVATGDSGELVARLVLLLAMDTVGAVKLRRSVRISGRYYAGAFYSVCEFLTVLHGGSSVAVEDKYGDNVTVSSAADLEAFEAKWSGWRVGFSHFVQLTKEQTEECLWALLARRAAGLLPRDSNGVDLLIPVFKDTEISMILVQVNNSVDGDPSFPDSVIAMRPKSCFTGETFRNQSCNDVIRIYMSLRGAKMPRRFFLRDPGEKSKPVPEPASYVLCMQGLDAWHVKSATDGDAVVFLSRAMVVAVKNLLEPWWQPAQLIKADLAKADAPKPTTDTLRREIIAEASRPLVESVVEGKWSHAQLVADTEVSVGTRSNKRKAGNTEATMTTERGPKRKTG